MKKLSLFTCIVLLGFSLPMFAEQTSPAQSPTDEVQSEDRQRLDGQLGREERRRLRGDLNEYARKAYPDNEQVEGRRRMMQERFRTADGFGAITRSEAQLRMPKLARHFDEIDTNNDGVITRDEMNAAREKEKKIDSRHEAASLKGDDRLQ